MLLLVVGLVLAALLVIITLLVFSHWRRMVEQRTCANHTKDKTGVVDTREWKDELTKDMGWQIGTKDKQKIEGNYSTLSKVNHQ